MIRRDEHSQPDAAQPLLRPLDVGCLRLPNRIVMAPLTRARADNRDLVPTELHAAHYAQRAGAGLIVGEATWVSEQGIGFANVPGIYTVRQVEAWKPVTDLVHALGGRIVLQLWHAGAHSHPDLLGGKPPAGPSAVNPCEMVPTPGGRKPTLTPREMTRSEIERAIADYAAAATHAHRAGFDGVEIAANGTYLIAQFLNPRLNRRADAYGEERHRFLLEVVDAVGSRWRPERVGVRLSPFWGIRDRGYAHELPFGDYPYQADETTCSDYDRLVSALDRRRVAYIHLRGPALTNAGAGPDLHAFARYRRLFSGILIANHGFTRATGNAVVAAGIADAVSFGRLFVANPDLVTRFALTEELASGDRLTFYGGGVRGYLDYPIWSPAAENGILPSALT